jgi:hypothetical protein
LGVTLLSRLDLVFFVLVVLAHELFGSVAVPIASRARSVIKLSAITSCVVAPYLLWNRFYFHHLEPISGAIKGSFPHHFNWHIGPAGVPVVIAILLNGSLLFKDKWSAFDVLCILTAVAAASHLAYTLYFGGLSAWYLTTGYLGVSLCITWLVDWVIASRPAFGRVEPVLCCVLFLGFLSVASLRLFSDFSYTRLKNHQVSFNRGYLEPKRALAMKLRETLPVGSGVFIFDAPGGVAYYSGMAVIPADGLVTDYAYNHDLERQGFERYAAENHIDYFITPYLKDGDQYDYLFLQGTRLHDKQIMRVKVPLGERSAGAVTLLDSDLLFRFREINPGFEITYPEIGVWRLRHSEFHVKLHQ